MSNQIRKVELIHPGDHSRVFKDVSATYGTDVDGNPTYAMVVALEPNSVGGGGSSPTLVDEAAYTEGTSIYTPIGGEFKTSPTALTTGQGGVALLTAHRSLTVTLFGSGGAEVGTSGAPVRVDPTGTTTQPVSGTITANQGTANTAANAWPQKVTDGTNTAAVKAASTAAVATDPALVVAISPNNSVAVTGTFWQATQPVSGTVTANQGTANTVANGWPVKVTDGTNTQPTGDAVARAIFHQITDATNGPVAVKAASTAAVAADKALVVAISPNNSVVLGTGSNIVGKVELTDGTNLGKLSSTGGHWVVPTGDTSSGATTARLASSAASTNATSTKASAGTLYGCHVANTNAALRYVHFYDKASAPTVGTDTPVITIPVPPSSGGIVRHWTVGAKFASGIAYAMTTDAAAGNNAVAAGDLVGFHFDYV